MKKLMEKMDLEIAKLLPKVMPCENNSRVFGANCEAIIVNNANNLSKIINGQVLPKAGKKTIYDWACKTTMICGFDIKSKDLDDDKYSDGGVCSVGNILQFMTKENRQLIITEIGHSKVIGSSEQREIKYVVSVPFHLLPEDIYRIENLGTGQVRFNYSIKQAVDDNKVVWNRDNKDFFDIFCKIAKEHYKRVAYIAEKERTDALYRFKNGGYKEFLWKPKKVKIKKEKKI